MPDLTTKDFNISRDVTPDFATSLTTSTLEQQVHVGEEGYNTWYNTEEQAATAIKSMRTNGINADKVARAYDSNSNEFKFKIYRSMEEINQQNNEYAARQATIQARETAAADMALAEKNNIDGFGSDQTPMQLGKTITSLNKAVQFEGKPTTIKAIVKKFVESGELTSTEQHNVIKPMTRTQFNRANQQEQDAHEKKIKDAGKKTIYYVGDYNLGKTAHDYAQHLINNKTNDKNPRIAGLGDIEMPKTLDPAAEKYLADRQQHNDQAEEYKRLRTVGQEALPGIRFQDATDVGRVYESFKKGDLTENQWNDYTADLISSNKVTPQPTRADYEVKPPFDDEYTGPRYKYGMINRPYGISTAPKGAILMSYKPEDKESGSRHGTIEYPFQLTKEDVYNFELVDFPAIKQNTIDFINIRNSFVNELEKRGFMVTIPDPIPINSKNRFADRFAVLAVSNGTIQASIESYDNKYYITLNTTELRHPLELDFKTPADINIEGSLKWIDKEIAKSNVLSELSDHEKHINEVYHETLLYYEAEMYRRGFFTMFGVNEQSMIATIDFSDDKMLATRIYQDKQGCHIELSKDDTVMLSHMIFDTPDKININRTLEIVDSELANHIIPELTDQDKIKSLALALAQLPNEVLSYEQASKLTGLTKAELDQHWQTAKAIATNAINDATLKSDGIYRDINYQVDRHTSLFLNGPPMVIYSKSESDLKDEPMFYSPTQGMDSLNEQTQTFTKAELDGIELTQYRPDAISISYEQAQTLVKLDKENNKLPFTNRGITLEAMEAINKEGLFTPDEYETRKAEFAALANINPSITNPKTGGITMENSANETVPAKTEYNCTGARLAEKLSYLEKSQLTKLSYLEKHLNDFKAMPESTESTNRKTGEVFTITKEQALANLARKEAIDAMSKGEYVSNIIEMGKINKKRASGEISSEDIEKHAAMKTVNIKLAAKEITPEAAAEAKIGYVPNTTLVRFDKINNRNAKLGKEFTYKFHTEQLAKTAFMEANPTAKKEDVPLGPARKAFNAAFYFNCTEDGIKDQIEKVNKKHDIVTNLLANVNEVPDRKFVIAIKEQRNLPNLSYDQNFLKQLDEALTAKNAPAPAPAPADTEQLKKSKGRSRK